MKLPIQTAVKIALTPVEPRFSCWRCLPSISSSRNPAGISSHQIAVVCLARLAPPLTALPDLPCEQDELGTVRGPATRARSSALTKHLRFQARFIISKPGMFSIILSTAFASMTSGWRGLAAGVAFFFGFGGGSKSATSLRSKPGWIRPSLAFRRCPRRDAPIQRALPMKLANPKHASGLKAPDWLLSP
jgi:hypothetical protein